MGHQQQVVINFTNKLYKHVIESQKDEPCNTCLSSLSMFQLLGVILAGSKGETRAELLNAMQLPTDMQDKDIGKLLSDLKYECLRSRFGTMLVMRNGIFLDKSISINKDYEKKIYYNPDATCEKVDIRNDGAGARQLINNWISETTEGKITDLIPEGEPDQDVSFLLVNAIYFQGNWEHVFDKEKTKPMDFTLINGDKKSVPVMFIDKWFDTIHMKNEKLRAVRIPFKSSLFKMLIILPDEHNGLPTLLSSISTSDLLKDIISRYKDGYCTKLYLPRFTLHPSPTRNMVPHLRSLGINRVFEKELAELDGIGENVSVSTIYHDAMLEVNEEGAVAAAASASTLFSKGGSNEFKACHPFVIALLYDKTPVFIGHVCDPQA